MNELEIQNEELMRENAFMIYNHVELESVERDHAVYKLNIRPESKNPYGMAVPSIPWRTTPPARRPTPTDGFM